jgi:hypothetical protein
MPEIEEGNKIISKYMGEKTDFKYHLSLDYLHPVLIRLKVDSNKDVRTLQEYSRINLALLQLDIPSIWLNVVAYITWLNEYAIDN